MTELEKKWRFEIYIWQRNNSGSFCSKLLELFTKADLTNRIRLATAFPEAYDAYNAWYNSPSEGIFLEECREYGVDLYGN